MRQSLHNAEENSGDLERWVSEKVDSIKEAEQQLDLFLDSWNSND